MIINTHDANDGTNAIMIRLFADREYKKTVYRVAAYPTELTGYGFKTMAFSGFRATLIEVARESKKADNEARMLAMDIVPYMIARISEENCCKPYNYDIRDIMYEPITR